MADNQNEAFGNRDLQSCFLEYNEGFQLEKALNLFLDCRFG